MVSYLDQLPAGTVVVDCGCGNGRYMSPPGKRPSLTLGNDVCHCFVEICMLDKGMEAVWADTLRLPWRDACADVAISIAVLHHIATEERRLMVVKELARVVKPGGEILLEG